MAEIINVKDLKDLKFLYDNWAMTWEGLRKEDFELAMNECGGEGVKGYVITGADMNKLSKLHGDNTYSDDLNIFAIYPFKGLAIQVGARWMTDIIDNNLYREHTTAKTLFKNVE